jgi:hypothetical protein
MGMHRLPKAVDSSCWMVLRNSAVMKVDRMNSIQEQCLPSLFLALFLKLSLNFS